ncbi:MAG: NAD-dependent epimerase/dehydratase family protein [Candidatus Lambdaproteobacteria bacterium]|nr:NAD-dependent epimerase/dehydratase family protein [Candidatus Lambdaproteobacteria bacterium]
MVTGANGFVGRRMCPALLAQGHVVRRGLRAAPAASASLAPGEQAVVVGDIGPETDWRAALDGVERVLHLAGRAHVMRDTAADPAEAFHRVNTLGTQRLMQAAGEAGVRRLVFVSTIHVNGQTSGEQPFREADAPHPVGPYAQSKWEAEQIVRDAGARHGLETVVVRPPLVYGPGVKGNFLRLLSWVARGVPLPLAALAGRRSLVALDNLVDLLACCLSHPAAAGELFLAADGEDLTTPELIRRIAACMGQSPRLFPFPPAGLALAARLAGATGAWQRLSQPLQVSAAHNRARLQRREPLSVDEGLLQTVCWFQAHRAAETDGGAS